MYEYNKLIDASPSLWRIIDGNSDFDKKTKLIILCIEDAIQTGKFINYSSTSKKQQNSPKLSEVVNYHLKNKLIDITDFLILMLKEQKNEKIKSGLHCHQNYIKCIFGQNNLEQKLLDIGVSIEIINNIKFSEQLQKKAIPVSKNSSSSAGIITKEDIVISKLQTKLSNTSIDSRSLNSIKENIIQNVNFNPSFSYKERNKITKQKDGNNSMSSKLAKNKKNLNPKLKSKSANLQYMG